MLIEAVSNIQKVSGREETDVTADTVPLDDLPGFDSLNGVEITVDVMEQLELPLEANNIFVSDEKPLSIRDVAKMLSDSHPKLNGKVGV
ncbi:acyl carrier protein [Pandoraea aquatica]|nr:acyl carrier protein [Pandoraea aquatica]